MSMKRQGGFLVAKAHHVAGRIFTRMLKDHGIEVNPSQGRVLFPLWREDRIPIHELAKRTALGKSTLTAMLDRLEDAGHVRRVRSESDRRVILVERTEKDRAAQATYERVSEAMTELYYRGLSEDEIAAFERTLERIVANLSVAEKEKE